MATLKPMELHLDIQEEGEGWFITLSGLGFVTSHIDVVPDGDKFRATLREAGPEGVVAPTFVADNPPDALWTLLRHIEANELMLRKAR